MNKNQLDGTLKQAEGKVQQKAGEILGNHEAQAKGIAKQVQGKAEVKLGDAKEAVHDASKALKR